MNDAQKLAIWLEVVKAALVSPAAQPQGQPLRNSEHVANFAVDVADRVVREIASRGKEKP